MKSTAGKSEKIQFAFFLSFFSLFSIDTLIQTLQFFCKPGRYFFYNSHHFNRIKNPSQKAMVHCFGKKLCPPLAKNISQYILRLFKVPIC